MNKKAQQLTIWRALNAALHDEFTEDPSTIIMGEDITTWGTGGGIYGVTRKMASAFGKDRVRDTPISEEALISAGVGAAMAGTRTVVEIMYSDFMLLGADGLINQAAKSRYMFGGQFSTPLVVRTNGGSGIGKAAQHSQSLETMFAHIPGLEVVVPGTADDAYGLLRSAIKSNNPTVFLEHKGLYYDKGLVTKELVPLGKARVAREGKDITIVATQLMAKRALEAAETLSAQGVDVEVIDPRTLFPFDMDTVFESVRKTRHLLVVHEAVRDFGWGGEFISSTVQECWGELDAAPRRLGAARTPIPYSEELENAVVPSVQDIIEETLAIVAQRQAALV
jgi:acetoin:2,6-dichlorophenolindophenol oxidoreductase subunit beta